VDELPRWKPNSAVVFVDFLVRHGFVLPDEPGYLELLHLLKAGGFGASTEFETSAVVM
jgi:hypothetical protein